MAIVKPLETEPGARRRLSIASPATLEPIGQIEIQTAEDVRATVQKAHQAQPAWAALSFEQRGEYMLRALKILLDRQDDFIDVIIQETPVPRLTVVERDIFASCDALDYYAKNTAKFLATRKVDIHGMLGMIKDLYITYKPLGVVGVISPWNGPFVLSIVPTIQALMAGNAVVLKPSSITPMSGKLVGDLFSEAGIPEAVITVIIGDSETGQALLESGVDKISFTGSVSVGREVAKVLVGGRRNPNLKGLYYEPTVLVDVTHDMLIGREETFGPVIPIMRVRDEDEAIRMANDSVFGLGANVWTSNVEKGMEMARRINSGSVTINDMTVTFGIPEAPFGGVNNSGLGRVNGEVGLKGYCNIQPVIIDRFGGIATAEKYPVTVQKARDLQELIRSIWGPQFGG
jgi:acyl-CoA reductase-like NAD-dependent aldehyde dehydrogenase